MPQSATWTVLINPITLYDYVCVVPTGTEMLPEPIPPNIGTADGNLIRSTRFAVFTAYYDEDYEDINYDTN